MKIHKLNLENYYRNAIDSAIAKMNGLPEAIFAGRPTYNEAALKFTAGETPMLALPQWAQFTIDLTQDKPSWAPASGSLKATFSASVSGVEAGDTIDLDSEKVYGASVTATAKQYTVGAGRYTVVIQANILNGDNEVVLSYTSNAMKVAMTKEGDTGPDTTLDVGGGGGSFTQEQADWNQSDNTKVDYIKNKPTIPAAQVNADWNADSGVAQILNKPTIPAAQVNADWEAESGVSQILNKPTIPTVNNATLTLTQGTTTLGTFTANASTDVTVDIPAGGGGGASIIEKTWSELKAMRDGGTLVPGQQYRITDYHTTVSNQSELTKITTPTYQFDIIVTAETASNLSEDARTAYRSGTNINNQWYFDLCKVKYCIDNDTNRFMWANSSGTGVIYWMKDPWNCEAWFDFTNIKFAYAAGQPWAGKSPIYFNPTRTFADAAYNSRIGPYISLSKLAVPIIAISGGNVDVGDGCNQIYVNITYSNAGSKAVVGPYCQNVKASMAGGNLSIGGGCNRIHFGDGTTLKNFYKNIEIGDGVSYVNLNCTSTTSASSCYQNVKVCSGVAGTSSTPLTISDSNVNQAYQTTFFNETDGTLKKQEGSTVTTYTPPA